MINTKKYFEKLLQGQFKNVEAKDLVKKYKETGNELILSRLYISNYAMLKSIANKFQYLTDNECSSLCLLEIENTIIDYDKSKNTKFSTLLYRYVYNEMRAKNNQKTYNKRKLNNSSSNDIKQNINDLVELNKEPGKFDYYELELNSVLDEINLTEKEEKFCKIVSMENYNITDTEISEILDITPQGVYYIKNKIKEKLQKSGGIECLI